eukprot:CAMPEP_0168520142 /NCGR_PEP_ID=MMETSP0405-20121227/7770_1 /TAXON_ID=498012 /ORGANISM="Trichosphaerium sp, Strain Am-I-7 wt" /LENGTH=957 /DNA_ID=CAMNT_0008540885 /DNA_START=325 /DNA_END=3198 /DNA_ORIENTATION=-
MFLAKYGKEFPNECVKSCCVNKKIVETLSRRLPDKGLVNYYLSNIANKHEIPWEAPMAPGKEPSLDLPSVPGSKPKDDSTPKPAVQPKTVEPKKTSKFEFPDPSTSVEFNSQHRTPIPVSSDPHVAGSVNGILAYDMSGNYWCNDYIISGELPGGALPGPVFVAPQDRGGAEAGDRVMVLLHTRTDGKLSGKVGAIVERAAAKLVSTDVDDTGADNNLLLPAVKLTALLKKDKAGHFWAIEEKNSRSAPIYIAPRDRSLAEDGDRVNVELHNRTDGKRSGKVVGIIDTSYNTASERNKPPEKTMQGRLAQDKQGNFWVIDDTNKIKKAVYISPNDLNGAKAGDIVVVALHNRADGKMSGRIVQVVPKKPAFKAEEITGLLTVESDGKGFLEHPITHQTVFIPFEELNGAENYDMVSVAVVKKNLGLHIGKVLSVVERGRVETKTRITVDRFGNAFVPHPRDLSKKIVINNHFLNNAKDGSLVHVEGVLQREGNWTGRVLQVIGSAISTFKPQFSNPGLEFNSHMPAPVTPTVEGGDTGIDELDMMEEIWAHSTRGVNNWDDKPQEQDVQPVLPSPEEPTNIVQDEGKPVKHNAVVIDFGSGTTKAGLAGDTLPTVSFPTIIGTPLVERVMSTEDMRAFYVGNEAQERRGILELSRPIQRGFVKDWDDYERLIDYTYKTELLLKPTDYPLLVTDPPLNRIENRKKMAEIFFEKYNVPGLYIATQGVLALTAFGSTTGVVLDIGDGCSHAIPIYDSYYLPQACYRLNLGGHDIDMYLAKLLGTAGSKFTTSSEMRIVRDIKETYCRVALEYEKEMKTDPIKLPFDMPDGQKVMIAKEAIQAPEILFDPSIIGMEGEFTAIQHMLRKSISQSDKDVRKQLLANIVLAGGTTRLSGFAARLESEMKAVFPSETVSVRAHGSREYLAWMGGSKFASKPNFMDFCVSASEYNEMGAEVIEFKL